MEPRIEQPAPKSVLVVDDDPKSLRILEVSLRSEGFDVKAAPDAGAATAWMENNVPGLVIAATGLAGVDGFELCRRMKEQPAHALVPFMLMGEATAANKIRSIEIGADEFVGKPVFVKDVLGRVSLLLRRRNWQRMETDAAHDQGFSGALADISVVDLVQTMQGQHRSGVIHLRSQHGGKGEIYFRQGTVVDAEVGRLSGREAMFRLFSWSQGTYRIEPKSIRRKDAVGLAPAALVMEGMRRLDDWQRLLKDLPPLQTVFEVDYRVLAERLAEIPDEVNAILRLFDGARTLLNVIDDCGIADAEALGLAGKLYAERIVRDVQAPTEEVVSASPAAEGWLTEAAGPFRPPTQDETEAAASDENDIHGRRTGPQETLQSASAREALPTEMVSSERSAPDTTVQTMAAERDEFAWPAATERAPEMELAPGVSAPLDESESSRAPPAPSAEPEPAAIPEEAPPVGVSSSAIPALRADESAGEPAIVVPVSEPDGDARRTLLAAGGVSEGGGTNDGLAAIAGSLEGQWVPAPSRATEPGIGPPVDASPQAAAGEPAHLQSGTESTQQIDAVSRSEALDELNLPSRHRGPLVLIGGAVLLAGLVFVAQRGFSGPEPAPAVVGAAPAEMRSTKESLTPVAPAKTPGKPAEAAKALEPATPPVPVAEEKPSAPAVELPSAPSTESHGEPAREPPLKETGPATKKDVAAKIEPAPVAAAARSAAGPPKAAIRAADFPALLERCRDAFTQGKMRDAATACAAAKDANGESGDALLLLAHVEFNRNHLKEALQWAERAIKIDPNLADAYVIFGGVQQDAGRNREAKWAYKKYLELAPRGQYAADLRAIVDTL